MESHRPSTVCLRKRSLLRDHLTGGVAVSYVKVSHSDWLNELRKDEKYADLTIKCKDQSWMVHRIIVCQQSGFSEGACNGEFKEASTGVITLEEERPFVVEMLLSFVYTGHYILPPAAHTILANEALLHLQAYTAGQRYLVAGLMEMAKQQFLDLVGSKIIRIDVLQEVINWFYHCIPDSNDLRIFRKQVALILRPELDCRMQDKKFRKLVRKEPEFAVELLMASFGEPQDRSATL